MCSLHHYGYSGHCSYPDRHRQPGRNQQIAGGAAIHSPPDRKLSAGVCHLLGSPGQRRCGPGSPHHVHLQHNGNCAVSRHPRWPWLPKFRYDPHAHSKPSNRFPTYYGEASTATRRALPGIRKKKRKKGKSPVCLEGPSPPRSCRYSDGLRPPATDRRRLVWIYHFPSNTQILTGAISPPPGNPANT